MIIYVEKRFLDEFNSLSEKDINTKYAKIIKNIFNSFGDIGIYTDMQIETTEDFDKLKVNNIQFSHNVPITIKSIREHFDKEHKNESTIIFYFDEETWHKDAEDKGALCLTFKNYKKKLKQICKICSSIKVDLSQQFPGWNIFNELREIPKNSLVISDKYLIQNNNNIHENVKHFLENIVTTQNNSHTEIHTEPPGNRPINIDLLYNNFTQQIQNYELSFQILLRKHYPYFTFHDRLLYSNFFYIEIPVGFNFSTTNSSNSIIRVEHIFEKFHYDRVKSHMLHFKKVKRNYAQVYPES